MACRDGERVGTTRRTVLCRPSARTFEFRRSKCLAPVWETVRAPRPCSRACRASPGSSTPGRTTSPTYCEMKCTSSPSMACGHSNGACTFGTTHKSRAARVFVIGPYAGRGGYFREICGRKSEMTALSDVNLRESPNDYLDTLQSNHESSGNCASLTLVWSVAVLFSVFSTPRSSTGCTFLSVSGAGPGCSSTVHMLRNLREEHR